jgi:hypothetical protein
VTRIEWDDTMRRRMVETAGRDDAGYWLVLVARALAFPLPYPPAPRDPSTIYASASRTSWSPIMTFPGRCPI